MIIKVSCVQCSTEHNIRVRDEDYARFENGELAQNAFQYLDAGKRELLISGICDSCWNKLFNNSKK